MTRRCYIKVVKKTSNRNLLRDQLFIYRRNNLQHIDIIGIEACFLCMAEKSLIVIQLQNHDISYLLVVINLKQKEIIYNQVCSLCTAENRLIIIHLQNNDISYFTWDIKELRTICERLICVKGLSARNPNTYLPEHTN